MLDLDCGTALVGKREATLANSHAMLEPLGLAFVVMADWNATPGEVREAGWTDKLKATAIFGLALRQRSHEKGFTCIYGKCG